MATEVETPIGAKVDPDDISGSVMTWVLAFIGLVGVFGVGGLALAVYNKFADATPDSVAQRVSIA